MAKINSQYLDPGKLINTVLTVHLPPVDTLHMYITVSKTPAKKTALGRVFPMARD